MKTALYTANFNVRSYEVGDRQQATLTSIANYLQEIAGLHAHRLNFDITHLNKRGLTWVLFKMHIVVAQYPRSEEHTSELQSRGHLVCRLLLEKKTLHQQGQTKQ